MFLTTHCGGPTPPILLKHCIVVGEASVSDHPLRWAYPPILLKHRIAFSLARSVIQTTFNVQLSESAATGPVERIALILLLD